MRASHVALFMTIGSGALTQPVAAPDRPPSPSDSLAHVGVTRAAVAYALTDLEAAGYPPGTHDLRLDAGLSRPPLSPQVTERVAAELELSLGSWEDAASCPPEPGERRRRGCTLPRRAVFLGVGRPEVRGDTVTVRIAAKLPDPDLMVWTRVVGLELVRRSDGGWTVSRVLYEEAS